MKIVSKGLGREIFSEGGPGVVRRYREMRDVIGRRNYDFFMKCLKEHEEYNKSKS